ncbi:hypothetical protein ACHAXR_010949 [Thalassiosira sp. AJA248-18]
MADNSMDMDGMAAGAPASPSSPKSPSRKRSVSGVLFTSLKTHLTVVRAAISHKTPTSRGYSDSGAQVKDGELYTWDAESTPPSELTPKRKTLSSGNLSLMGSSTSTVQISQRKRSYNKLEQPILQLPNLDNNNNNTATSSAVMHEMTGSPPQQANNASLKQRHFSMSGGGEPKIITTTTSMAAAPSPGNASSHSRFSHSKSLSAAAVSQSVSMLITEPRTPYKKSWSWGEQIFFSEDDESAADYQNSQEGDTSSADEKTVEFVPPPPLNNSVTYDTTVIPPHDHGDDDDTCNNTIVEKVRQRSKKASRASTVGAFVTFLKALFGIGMLSNPAVLGEVGLLLGTFCHLFIVVGCAFACYLLLAARQMAKMEVMAKQRRDEQKREEHNMWRAEMENRAAMRAGRSPGQQNRVLHRTTNDPTLTNSSLPVSNDIMVLDKSEGGPMRHHSEQTLEVVNTAGSSSAGEEDWTVAPVPMPLTRVGTSIINPPKQGWGRCEDALQNAAGRTPKGSSTVTSYSSYAATTPSCGNVQLIKQSTKNGSRESLSGSHRSMTRNRSKSKTNTVSDEYQRFTDKVHNSYMMSPPPPEPSPPPSEESSQVRLVTYGDVAKYLAGKKASFFIVFTIVTVHLMFASGMVHLAVENLCYVVGWERLGWSYVEEYVEEGDDDRRRTMLMRRLGPSEDENDDNNASRSSDEEEYYLEWKGPDFVGRLAMASLLFPIIHGLLQIPNLTDLATISTFGLITYAFGCIGSMLYTALVLTDGHPFLDHPDDMWKTKWSGIPTYVATTIYCIEGINLALPTVSSIEGAQRWGGGGLMRKGCKDGSGSSSSKKESESRDLSVFIVVGAVFLYGMVTLVVSWIGLAGGLGGGIGTIHGEDGCWDVTYCLNSSAVRFVYMLSLGIALVLTLPVILYPSTEMLEVWLDERSDERRRKMEAASMMSRQRESNGAFWLRQKSLLPDDETVCTVKSDFSPRSSLGIIEMGELSCSTSAGEYVAPEVNPSRSPEPSPMHDNESFVTSTNATGSETTKLKAKRKLKYWKLRMFLAFIICIIGTIEGSFPSVLKAAEVIRGVGLSIAGLIFPPLLYMSAVGGNFSVPMAAAMALLIGLGLFNIVLVLMSAFGSRDFIVEEGRGNFYEM